MDEKIEQRRKSGDAKSRHTEPERPKSSQSNKYREKTSHNVEETIDFSTDRSKRKANENSHMFTKVRPSERTEKQRQMLPRDSCGNDKTVKLNRNTQHNEGKRQHESIVDNRKSYKDKQHESIVHNSRVHEDKQHESIVHNSRVHEDKQHESIVHNSRVHENKRHESILYNRKSHKDKQQSDYDSSFLSTKKSRKPYSYDDYPKTQKYNDHTETDKQLKRVGSASSLSSNSERNRNNDATHIKEDLRKRPLSELQHSGVTTEGCRPKTYRNNDFSGVSDKQIETKTPIDKSKKAPKRGYGFPFLKNLLGKDAAYIILELTNNTSSLRDCVQRTSQDEEFLEVFLEVLSEAFSSRSTPKLMAGLYDNLRDCGFFETVMVYLIDLLAKITDESFSGKTVERKLRNILQIIVEQITRNPLSCFTFIRIHTILGQLIEGLLKSTNLSDEIVTSYQLFTEQKKKVEKEHKLMAGVNQKSKPPDDFRQYSVCPIPAEITGSVRPFLRPNKVQGEYEDLDHYLDVQFRLLREDFLGPLREGISEYIRITNMKNDENKERSKALNKLDLKIYENVKVHAPVVTEYGLCYKLQLEMTEWLANTNWAFSKRLMFGALVCLTDGDFSSYYLGTIVGRDESDIRNGLIIVYFEDEAITTRDILQKTFKMAETTAYFESYRHVLSGLQSIKKGDLPFEKYIVSCDKVVSHPKYIKPGVAFDLRPLADHKAILYAPKRLHTIANTSETKCQKDFSDESTPAKSVPVLELEKWPGKEVLHLDESQYKAIQSALTHEFAIIQGPPGTGKTYVGLQIVRALLHNRSMWDEGGNGVSPILIVCFTNHALDQFLEGLLTCYKGDVLRVGGRSESQVLESCNLKHLRQVRHPPKSTLGKLKLKKENALNELKVQTREIQTISKVIELYYKKVISEVKLRRVMGEKHYNSLVEDIVIYPKKERNVSYIVKWLGIKHTIEMLKTQLPKENEDDEDKCVEVENERVRQTKELMVDNDEDFTRHADTTYIKRISEQSIAFSEDDIIEITRKLETQGFSKKTIEQLNQNIQVLIERKISEPDIMRQDEVDAVQNVWKLDHHTKWRLYRYWIVKLCMSEYNKVDERRLQFEEAAERYREAMMQEDKEIMRQATVIGITTSGAARYQSVLRDISPKIIVVEEAAEVLEAHIITTLSKGCEHLILIGDHKQLRPKPFVHRLAVKFKLEISLFERMVKNGMPLETLELQHRMRPEISAIVKHIYPHLRDHEQVLSHPVIKGVATNLFFINHHALESNDGNVKSYSNLFEARYAVSLCRFLLMQGYTRNQITILTTYTGQLMLIRRNMPREEFQGVRVTVVDNYQGEENDIVILSLVRSNKGEKIGFMKTENRICVALSRAKMGFYVIGNFDHLAAYSVLWKEITNEMKEKGHFGNGLKLYCQNHPQDAGFIASSSDDFKNAPDGGCTKMCITRLKCGHTCRRNCHILDTSHALNICKQPCNKVCDLGHKCPNVCNRCTDKCEPCQVFVPKVIPRCNHEQMVRCFMNPENYRCQAPCEEKLSCGHRCLNKCGDSHTATCNEKIDKTWPCGHTAKIKCFEKENKVCPHPCEKVLKCEHVCSGTCGKCFQGTIHMQCRNKCRKVLVCAHECKSVCNNCPPCTEPCQNRCVHNKCDKTCGEPCVSCKMPCSWKCEHYKCSKLCSEPCNRRRCNRPCRKVLECKHKCIGFCGEPCPPLCRKCHRDIVQTIFFGDEDKPKARFVFLEDCGHIFESWAMDKYMKTTDDDTSITLKTCPKCKTPIRRCLRYNNQINRTLQDIERVKENIIGNTAGFSSIRRNIETFFFAGSREKSTRFRGKYLAKVYNLKTEDTFIRRCGSKLQTRIESLSEFCTESQLKTVEIQVQFIKDIVEVREKVCKVKTNEDGQLDFGTRFIDFILIPRDFISEQEIEDIQYEIQKAKYLPKYLKLEKDIESAGKRLEAADTLEKLKDIVMGIEKFTDERETEAKSLIVELSKMAALEGLGITEEERRQIIKAVGLSKGHWFKCPKNHVYAIGDCGGANQKSTCPECHSAIGGTQHRLADGNRLAPEMDGARFAAYSEEANNMANFDLNNLH